MVRDTTANAYSEYGTFLEGLRKAGRGVALVVFQREGKGVGLCSGWLVTDDLLIVPSHAATGQDTITCSFYGKDDVVATDGIKDEVGKTISVGARMLELTLSTNELVAPAILRLVTPLPGRALMLEMKSMSEKNSVYLLHHPAGEVKLIISFGKVLANSQKRQGMFDHDVSTGPGSGGGPLLSLDGKVVGMHMLATQEVNSGFKLSGIFEYLRKSPMWKEIAEYHHLSNAPAIPVETTNLSVLSNDILIKAALQWDFDKSDYSEAEQEKLKSFVVNRLDSRWMLRPADRQKIINEASSKNLLQPVAIKGREKINEGQQVINSILSGNTKPLVEIEDSLLPYWLQAVRWFQDAIPMLPSASQVNKELKKRRSQRNLETIVGPDFRGREEYLSTLQSWYNSQTGGPMVISGIGGIGKSTLISRFILRFDVRPMIFWLDFDRADLAPDDANSIMRLLLEQASTESDEFDSFKIEGKKWQDIVAVFGAAIVKLTKKSPPILVMDGFEVAQHNTRYNEIWTVLGKITTAIPRLKVIISGRAPVESLYLSKKKARNMVLDGMDPGDASAWLKKYKIDDEEVVNRIIKESKGVPLVLKLVVRFKEEKNDLKELMKSLSGIILTGYLYQRILNRVIDKDLKPIAKDVLILRYLTAEIVEKIFYDAMPTDKTFTPQVVYEKLLREMALVKEATDQAKVSTEGIGIPTWIDIRPEVRTAVIRILEREDMNRVQEIDERACKFYSAVLNPDIRIISERIYHNLRLGKLEAAKPLWQEGCERFLTFSTIDDLPEEMKGCRDWLSRMIQHASPAKNLESWEQQSFEQIKDLLARNRMDAVREILKGREQRSPKSPLLVYDAWIKWKDGDLKGARKVLKQAKPTAGIVERDRHILRAALAFADRDADAADNSLELAERSTEVSEEVSTLIRMSRLEVNTNIKSELEVYRKLRNDKPAIDRLMRSVVLTKSDILLPQLSDTLYPSTKFNSLLYTINIPVHEEGLQDFLKQMESRRRDELKYNHPISLMGKSDEELLKNLEKDFRFLLKDNPQQQAILKKMFNLAVCGWRRVFIITQDLFLSRIMDVLSKRNSLGPVKSAALKSTLGALRSLHLVINTIFNERAITIDQWLDAMFKPESDMQRPVPEAMELAIEYLGTLKQDTEVLTTTRILKSGLKNQKVDQSFYYTLYDVMSRFEKSECRTILFLILSPSCIDLLCKHVLGIPDHEPREYSK